MGQVKGKAMADETPHNPEHPQTPQYDEVDETIKSYKNTGITMITERRVEIGPDGRRRVLSRRKILQTPPEDNGSQASQG
jgi:hypothetical protein